MKRKTSYNIEIMPASLLASKDRWKTLSKKMPAGSCLLITTGNNQRTEDNIVALAKAFLRIGRIVSIYKT
jgi:hypothetical protein